jgi:hypothetical protein
LLAPTRGIDEAVIHQCDWIAARIMRPLGPPSECALLPDLMACAGLLAGWALVAAGGPALSESDHGGLAADRAPAGREEAKPLLG